MKRRLLHWKNLIKERTRKRYRQRLILFFGCLFLALAFWFLNILNKQHLFKLENYIQFYNLPEDKALSMKQARKISFTVQGSGWNFVRSRMQLMSDTLRIDFRTIQDKDEIDLNKSLLDFESQWNRKLRIMNIYPSKINYIVEKKRIRKVPIIPVYTINFTEQYGLSDDIHWYPDSIYISGPIEYISKISAIKTKPVVLNNLNITTQLNVNLDLESFPNITTTTRTTRISFPVEQFTEGIAEVPISTRSDNNGTITFPSKCKVQYKVALTNYNKIIQQSFKVVAEKDVYLQNRLRLKLVSSPSLIKDVRIIPETVEFISIKR